MGQAWGWGVVAVTAVMAGACGKNAAELTKEHRPRLEARMQRIIAMVKQRPPVEKAPIDKLTFIGDQPNAMVVDPAYAEGGQDRNALVTTGHIPSVVEALSGPTDGHPLFYEQTYKAFLGAKYVVVVDVFALPAMMNGDKFSAGSARATIDILEIESGKRVEALSVEAGASDKVTVAEGKEQEGVEASRSQNLRRKANEAIGPYLADGEKPPF
jgi:hypothetical protein